MTVNSPSDEQMVETNKVKVLDMTLTKEKIVTSQTVRAKNTDKFLDVEDKEVASLE